VFQTSGYVLSYNSWGGELTFDINWTNDNLKRALYQTSLEPNTWYHLIGNFNGTNTAIYVNNILRDTKNMVGNIGDNTKSVTIGGSFGSSSRYFNGVIDSVRIYNKALTPDETIKFRII